MVWPTGRLLSPAVLGRFPGVLRGLEAVAVKVRVAAFLLGCILVPPQLPLASAQTVPKMEGQAAGKARVDEKQGATRAGGSVTLDTGLQLTVFPQRIVVRCEFSLSIDSARLLTERLAGVTQAEAVTEGPPVPRVPTAASSPAEAGNPAADAEPAAAGNPAQPDEPYRLIDRFQERAVPELESRLRLLIDGQPVALRFLGATKFPKHYVQLACDLEALLPAGRGTRKLEVRYGCFRGVAGQQRMAIRGKDGVVLRTSSVPTILARYSSTARPVGSAESIEAARRAEARFVVNAVGGETDVAVEPRPPAEADRAASSSVSPQASPATSPATSPAIPPAIPPATSESEKTFQESFAGPPSSGTRPSAIGKQAAVGRQGGVGEPAVGSSAEQAGEAAIAAAPPILGWQIGLALLLLLLLLLLCGGWRIFRFRRTA